MHCGLSQGSVMETPDTLQTDIEAEERPEAIEPTDIRTVFQAGQFLLMLLAACYVAGEIILPVILALVLNLVLQPVMRLLEKLHLPRTLAALAIIMVVFGSAVGLGAALSGPAASWAQKMPEGLDCRSASPS
jgi:predicted PurR-regulated permease PerM